MRCIVQDELYDFRDSSAARSALLKQCAHSVASDGASESVRIPLSRHHVELWDTEADLLSLSLADLIGVVKVCTGWTAVCLEPSHCFVHLITLHTCPPGPSCLHAGS